MTPENETKLPWWKGAAIYQIYPRSFADSNGDGVGDLPGIISKLDHIAELGADGIWISPFFTSPMHDFGYDVADYRDVDPIFGTLADFDRLVERAHALDLKLIIDQVYSHTSDQHEWFKDSRASRDSEKSDWYVWADAKPDGSPPNNWPSVFGGPAWSWDTRRQQYYLHNFLTQQPDLNFHNPAVQDAILDVAKFWLDRGVDGFRLDVANYYFHDQALRDNPPSGRTNSVRPYGFQNHLYNRSQPENLAFLERLRAVVDQYNDRMTVAEIASGSNLERSIEYTTGGTRLHTAYNFHLLECENPDPDFVQDALVKWQNTDAWPSWSLSNHDVKRSLTRWGGGSETPDRAKFLLALLFSLKGTVFLYQGEELGLPQSDVPFEKLKDPEAIRFWPDNLGRDGCRTPIPWTRDGAYAGFSTREPWLPVDEQHRELAVDVQAAENASTLQYTRTFLRNRRALPALTAGETTFRKSHGDLLVFERKSQEEHLICVFNFSSDKSAGVDLGQYGDLTIIEELCLGFQIERGSAHLEPNGCLFARIN